MEKISAINEAVEEYFSLNQSINEISAKDLMPWFIKKGIFPKDHKNGLPIRKILRDLDKKNQLSLVPSAFADRKTKNVNWYFVRSHTSALIFDKDAQVEKSEIQKTNKSEKTASRKHKDEDYVIDLCDELLNLKASRQHRFPFLLGDPGKNRRKAMLPVDSYYKLLSLVIEYRERQHTEEVRHFDKPDVMTVSGVHRGEQRRIYDQRRREELPKHGIKLIEISYSDFEYDGKKKLVRDYDNDIEVVRKILSENGV